jgi:hypothetical protein
MRPTLEEGPRQHERPIVEVPKDLMPAYLADATNTGNRRLQRIVCSVVVPDDHSRPQVAGIAIYENH